MNNRFPCGPKCQRCRAALVARNAASRAEAPVNATRESKARGVAPLPPGYYDLTRLTGKNLPSVEPGRVYR